MTAGPAARRSSETGANEYQSMIGRSKLIGAQGFPRACATNRPSVRQLFRDSHVLRRVPARSVEVQSKMSSGSIRVPAARLKALDGRQRTAARWATPR